MIVAKSYEHIRMIANKKLWDSGSEENKKLASKQKRKLQYIANIFVAKDPANPENEGKTFLFR